MEQSALIYNLQFVCLWALTVNLSVFTAAHVKTRKVVHFLIVIYKKDKYLINEKIFFHCNCIL